MTLPSSANLPDYPWPNNARQYDAEFLRMEQQALMLNLEGIVSTVTPPFINKLDGADSGSGIPGDLKATTGGSGLTISVAAGRAMVKGDGRATQGMYFCYVDVAKTVTMATADATNPRVDAIILQVEDSDVTGSQNRWQVTKQTGTATGGATLSNLTGAPGQAGGPALQNTALVLAYVLTTAAFAGPYVDATHIREARQLAVPKGTLMYYAARSADFNIAGTSSTKITNLEVNNVLPPAGGKVGLTSYWVHTTAAAGTSQGYIYEGTTTGGTIMARADFRVEGANRATFTQERWLYAFTTTGAAGGKSDFIGAAQASTAGSDITILSSVPAFIAVYAS
jgi:hypothetical protein